MKKKRETKDQVERLLIESRFFNENFRGDNRILVELICGILRNQDGPITLRHLFYLSVSAGIIENNQREYKRIGHIATRLREGRIVPLTAICDNVRQSMKPSSWSGLADFGDSVRDCYRKDLWASQRKLVEFFCEKDSVAGVIQPITREYDVALHPCRGYASVSFAGQIAATWAATEKPIRAYYCGDFDASGFDIERDLKEKLNRYSGGVRFEWERIAICEEDFDRENLIALPIKKSDNRAKEFLRKHGERCAELDALPPNELRRRVRLCIEENINPEQWERLQLIERNEQEAIASVIGNWREAG